MTAARRLPQKPKPGQAGLSAGGLCCRCRLNRQDLPDPGAIAPGTLGTVKLYLTGFPQNLARLPWKVVLQDGTTDPARNPSPTLILQASEPVVAPPDEQGQVKYTLYIELTSAEAAAAEVD